MERSLKNKGAISHIHKSIENIEFFIVPQVTVNQLVRCGQPNQMDFLAAVQCLECVQGCNISARASCIIS